MVVGIAVGLVGGDLLSIAMRHVPLPSGALYPLQTLLAADTMYGATTAARGSGFLAVFVAGSSSVICVRPTRSISSALAAACKAALVTRPGMVLSPIGAQPDIVEPDIAAVVARIIEVDAN